MNTCREYSKFDTFYNVIIIKNDSTYKLYQIKLCDNSHGRSTKTPNY